MFQKKLTLQYVIPLHNEEDCLLELYGRLKKIQDISRNTLHIEFIFVNDGSRDNTLVLLRQLSLSNVDVKVISLSRNFGHQIALSAGLNYANADYVLIMDGDLQDPPELMFEMLRMAEEGADIVYGQRLERAGETIFKKVTAKLFYRLILRLCNVDIPKDTGDFRLINKKVLYSFKKFEERHRFIRGMIPWLGFKSVPCYYQRDPRYSGYTKFPLKKMIAFALDAIFSFSNLPIRIGTYIGISLIMSTVPLIVYIVYLKVVLHTSPPGMPTILSAILFIGGIQIFMLGLLGEYIGKIYDEVKKRPLYIVDEVLNLESMN